MGYVVFIRTVGCPEFLHRQLPGGHQLGHLQELALRIALILVFHPADGRSVLSNVGMETQEADAVLEGEDLRLSVQRQLQRVQVRRYGFQAAAQVVLTLVDQVEIVHISAVELDTQLTQDQLVHTIQVQQRKSLIDLIAQRQALSLGAVDKQLTQPAYIRIVAKVIADDVLEPVVGNVIEKLGYVAFEDITLIAVPAVKLLHLLTEPVQGEQSAFSFLPGAVIQNEDFLHPGHQHIVAQTVLYDLILEACGLYHTLLRLVHLEFVVRGNCICLILQLVNEGVYAVQSGGMKPCRTFGVAFPASCPAEGSVHIVKVRNFFKFGHTAPSFLVYPHSGKVVRSFDVVY